MDIEQKNRETQLSAVAARERIEQLESVIRQQDDAVEGDSDMFPLTHTFCEGIYLREIFLPKGSLCVGKIHKTRHPNIILQGEVLVTTDRSEEAVRLRAPMYFISEPGLKKVVYAVEDSTWMTIHRTDKDTPEAVEEDVIARTYDELPEAIRKAIAWHS